MLNIQLQDLSVQPTLSGTYTVRLADGEQVECKTAFQLLGELASRYGLEKVEDITGVPRDKIESAARMLATIKPCCYYTFNGLEQQTNTAQTNRALSLLYALTGSFDSAGGNRLYPPPPANRVSGNEFLSVEANRKRLGADERPLGPAGTIQLFPLWSIRPSEAYRSVLHGKPYAVKALVGFGSNPLSSCVAALIGREAISKLDFYVQTELFMTPSAELADIVLPAASFWESWYVRCGFPEQYNASSRCVQLREAVVPPQHESWPDLKIIFELAKRMGFGDKFWDGDIEAAFNYRLAPLGLTVEKLRKHPSGIILDLPSGERSYSKKDARTGVVAGFNTPSRRIEVYCQLFKDYGYDPLPEYKEPLIGTSDKYPLLSISRKPLEYTHGWGRVLPSLRKLSPYPLVEINPEKARELGIEDGEWVAVETKNGSVTFRAKLTDTIAPGVVCAENGWWQACPELGLPGYDPFSSDGANTNLLYNADVADPISGSIPIQGYPCNIRKL